VACAAGWRRWAFWPGLGIAQADAADLAAGRIDYGLADTVYTAEGFLKSEAGKEFELKGEPVSDPLIGGNVGAAMRKGDPLLGEMNAAIKALRENGSYKAINDKYFAFDVFGS
jgi:ABC-type amino acid transport substrate-binding protein